MSPRTPVPIEPDVVVTAPTPPPTRSVYWYYSSENQSPLVRPEFLLRERRLLMPAQYAREHQNLWVDAADNFTIALDVDSAMSHGWTEQLEGAPDVAHVLTVDLGLIHDPSVLCVGHLDEHGVVIVDRLVTFQGSREEPVQLATVEACIRDLAARFPCWRIRIESWQGVSAVQTLTALGLPVELFHPTAKAHAEEWPILAQRLSAHTLVLPPHARLREELLNLSYEVTSTGIKVIDKGSVHQDHAVAVRMLCAAFAGLPVLDTAPSAAELAQLTGFARAAFGVSHVFDDSNLVGFADDHDSDYPRFYL
jgi:hypothetical protein